MLQIPAYFSIKHTILQTHEIGNKFLRIPFKRLKTQIAIKQKRGTAESTMKQNALLLSTLTIAKQSI